MHQRHFLRQLNGNQPATAPQQTSNRLATDSQQTSNRLATDSQQTSNPLARDRQASGKSDGIFPANSKEMPATGDGP
jgi:hypothetical protein